MEPSNEETKQPLDNSFGDHSHKSEEREAAQLSTPNIKQEETKDEIVSSNTANFYNAFHKIAPEKENNGGELSFDNDSAIVNFPMQIISNDNQNDGSISNSNSEALSRRDSLTHSISNTTAANYAHLIRSFHLIENPVIGGANSSFSNTTSDMNVRFSQLATLNRLSNRGTNLDFVEKIEEGMDNILYVLNTERMNIKNIKKSLQNEQCKFNERMKTENENWEIEKWQFIENEKSVLKLSEEWKEVLHLDIGGTHKISTTMATISKYPQSAIAAMFSGRHNLVKHKGRYFIDRDGQIFTLVIEYLSIGFIKDQIVTHIFHQNRLKQRSLRN